LKFRGPALANNEEWTAETINGTGTRWTSTESGTTARVIIIGAGFSGTLVAIHLLRNGSAVQIDIVDQNLPGRGLAYSTAYDEHLLNVPAVRMSAFGSEPLHNIGDNGHPCCADERCNEQARALQQIPG
jgi:cation diffusion facilitator CzcD-associated flavoprotein CzcO